MDSISIVSATLNEAENLPTLISRIRGALKGLRHEIVIVDDSFPDGTYELALRLADRAVVKRREGQSIALLTGIQKARYPIVVTMDADLENDPSEVPKLLSKLKAGYDIVVAVRGRLPRFSERLFSATIGKKIGVTDVLSNFRAMWRDRVADISLSRHETFGAEFLIRAYKKGLKIGQVQVKDVPRRPKPRIGGTLKANLRILKALLITLTIWLTL